MISGRCPPAGRLAAPHPAVFPRLPQSWYYAGQASALPRGAVMARRIGVRSLAIFRGEDGIAGAVEARCPHLGSDLARGRVAVNAVECPYHHFRFDRDGHCHQHALRTVAYAVEERFGALFVFLGARPPTFPLPSFDTDDLISAPPLHWRLETQWYMLGANAFDARHFALAHGRHLTGPPSLSAPATHSLNVDYEYAIRGHGMIDRLIRLASGPRVAFRVTAWGGTIILVRAKFARDESYGLVAVEPEGERATNVTVIVSARRTDTLAGRLLGNWLRSRLKRLAIRNMLLGDASALRSLDYAHEGLLSGDETVAAFLIWVSGLPDGDKPGGLST